MFNEKVEPQGWLTFAQNSDTVNYVNQAYLLALSIKRTCAINKFAVVVDTESAKTITPKQRKVFDYVIEVPRQDNPFALEVQSWNLTPFKETFKVESDMLIPRNLDHWWAGCQGHDVLLTSNVRDYQGKISNTRHYRKFFDTNSLVNSYNGFMYFRYCQDSMEFFKLAKTILENWQIFANDILEYNIYDMPDTDVIYSIAATMLEQVTCPISYPTFTHMKGAVNGWKPNIDWRNAVPWTLTKDYSLIVGGYAQQYPFHYFQKDFCTPELIQRYER